MFSNIAFYPSLGYNLLRNYLQPRKWAWYNRVDDTLLVGAMPFKSMEEELVQVECMLQLLPLSFGCCCLFKGFCEEICLSGVISFHRNFATRLEAHENFGAVPCFPSLSNFLKTLLGRAVLANER